MLPMGPVRCQFHGQWIPKQLPEMCPKCAKATKQKLVDCEHHGAQVARGKEGCGFCVAERLTGREIARPDGGPGVRGTGTP